MAFFGKTKKIDLFSLAEELGEKDLADLKVVELKDLILKNKAYEEEFVKDLLDTIVKTRLEHEEKTEDELEERRKREERDLEDRRKKEEREFELEKIRLEALNRSNFEETGNQVRETKKYVYDLQKLIPKFESGVTEISLYLIMFERQAKRLKIDESDFVSHLVGLLPIDIVQLIARESEPNTDNYVYIKTMLLKRFKLSPEKFRTKFIQYQRRMDSTYKDFTFELRNYLTEWLNGLEIVDFEQLKDLMVTDQLKRRVSNEIREHFLDSWGKITSASKLAEMLDEYENVRGNFKKPVNAGYSDRKRTEQNAGSQNREKKRYDDKSRTQGRAEFSSKPKFEERFEARKILRCFQCNSSQHLRPQCPDLKKNSFYGE